MTLPVAGEYFPPRNHLSHFEKRFFMGKAMTIAGLVVAGLVFLLFVLDFATGIPFSAPGKTMHIGAILFSVILGYLSWSTFREQK